MVLLVVRDATFERGILRNTGLVHTYIYIRI